MNSPLIVSFHIDAQKGFSELCPNELPVPGALEIVPQLLAQDEYADIRIGSKDWHPRNAVWIADQIHPQLTPLLGCPNADYYWNSHCVGGTYGAELLDGLPDPSEYDFFIWKGMEPSLHPYSACYHDLKKTLSTGVIEWIKSQILLADVSSHVVVVGGLALDFCVYETAMDLSKHIMGGFNVILNLAACRGIGDCTEAINKMKTAGIQFVNNAGELKDHPLIKGE